MERTLNILITELKHKITELSSNLQETKTDMENFKKHILLLNENFLKERRQTPVQGMGKLIERNNEKRDLSVVNESLKLPEIETELFEYESSLTSNQVYVVQKTEKKTMDDNFKNKLTVQIWILTV